MIPDAWRSGEAAVLGLGRTGIAAARFLVGEGFQVYASDFSDSDKNAEALAELRSRGVHIDLGSHDLDRIANATLVVTSPGIPPTAPPLVVAQSAGRTIVAELDLALLALQEIPSILVTGTNGKSTTTALIAHILNEAGSSAVAAGNIGYPLIEISQESARPEWLVVEASSYQLHFSSFHTPRIGVLTNLSPDHLEWHGSVEAYREAKKRLFLNASSTSEWILNGDDEAVLELAEEVPGVRRCWSLETKSDSWFDSANETLQLGGEILLQRQQLLLLGDHNVSNALAAVAVARHLGMKGAEIREALASFKGVNRRFTKVGEVAGVTIIDDYGHHPVEIAAVLRAARQACEGRVIAVHQPHRYTRLHSLFDDFCACFNDADVVGIADVYAAGEEPIPGASRDDLVAGLVRHGHRHALAVESEDDLEQLVRAETKPGDMVVCLGAGTISQWANNLPERLKG